MCNFLFSHQEYPNHILMAEESINIVTKLNKNAHFKMTAGHVKTKLLLFFQSSLFIINHFITILLCVCKVNKMGLLGNTVQQRINQLEMMFQVLEGDVRPCREKFDFTVSSRLPERSKGGVATIGGGAQHPPGGTTGDGRWTRHTHACINITICIISI